MSKIRHAYKYLVITEKLRAITLMLFILSCSIAKSQVVDPSPTDCAPSDATESCSMQQKFIPRGPPDDGEITITNNTGTTIYKIFAWPSDLGPRTYNLLNLPLLNGEKSKIKIDNAYRHCDFNFQYDVNDPVKMRNLLVWRQRGFKPKGLGVSQASICGGRAAVQFGTMQPSLSTN